MFAVNNLGMQFGGRKLFSGLTLTFQKGECYGIIGANGAGKSTLLRILSGDLEPTEGAVVLDNNERLSVLKQNHDAYNEETIRRTVLLGNPRLIEVMEEKDALYSKPDFSEEDGIKAGELEGEFADLGGWDADSQIETLLSSLGVPSEDYDVPMKGLDEKIKVKVLLAQALFGNPDYLLMDEPTNGLDPMAADWLEEYLSTYENTVLVVSHDRYFLNKVCTRMLDVDYGKITPFIGNYDFWYESSQLALKQSREDNAKKEERIKELKDFIARFAANAAKSRQATSRKKMLDRITLDDIKPSSRKYPFIDFRPEREIGNDCLEVHHLSVEGKFKDISFTLNHNEKVAFISDDTSIISALFDVIAGRNEKYEGRFKWGITVTKDYFPNDFSEFENVTCSLVDYLRPYSKEQLDSYIRGFLGRMLFSGDEALKPVNVLSGGEKVRLRLTRMMMKPSNFYIFDDPTNHLDLESVQSLNQALIKFRGGLAFQSHDREFIETIATRIIAITKDGTFLDWRGDYSSFLQKFSEMTKRRMK